MSDLNSDNPKEFYRKLSTDELASTLQSMKENIASLRQVCWFIEDELRDRMHAAEASVLLGDQFKVKASVKREVTWDQRTLQVANDLAWEEGKGDLFDKAFPLERECSVRNLNALLKLGGETARAIERAKTETKVKLEIKVEELSK